MIRLAFIFCLLPLLSWSQPIQRQFWTTNTNPREVIAQGTNVFITFSTPSPDVRQYLIDVPTSFGQTNNTILSAGTNVVIVTNASGGVTVYTISSVPGVQTNVTLLAAGTNVFVSSSTNNGVITYTIDVPTNAIPAQQTNWPWQSITNIASVQLPYSSITNPPSDIERTNWAITDITNSLNLTNWALLSTNTFTNVIVSAGSNVFVTPSVSGQLRTYTVDVPASSSGTVYASNVVSGGILPIGTVATNSPFPGSFLEGTTGTRYWSQDGATLTNLTGTNINGNLNVILLGTITNVINSPQVVSTNFIGNGAGLTNISGTITGNASNQVAFVAFNGTAPVWANAADTVYWREEFLPGTTEFWTLTSGSGGTGFGGFGSNVGHPSLGYMGVNMGTAGSYAEVQSKNTFQHGSGSIEFIEFDVKTGSPVNSGVNAANCYIGAMSSTAEPSQNGFWFSYNAAITNWQCVTALSSTYVTNNLPLQITTANTWWKMGFLWDASTNITFYINGTPVYTNSTSTTTPTGVSLVVGAQMQAPGTGTGTQTLSVDYISFYQKLGSSR